MELNRFSFRSKYIRGREVFDNSYLESLRGIICRDKGVFDLATRFFYLNSDNNQSVSDAYQSLLIYKQIVEIEANYSITSLYDELADDFIKFILPLFQRALEDYKKIRNQFIELLTLYWKALPGRGSKVFIEPLIAYKNKKCFAKAKYSNIKCDIVHIDYKNKCFEMYECKTTMRAFLADLDGDSRIGITKNHKKNIAKSKRKQNYLTAFYHLLKHKVKDIKVMEVAYITLAPKSDLYLNNSNISSIGKITVYTKEKLMDAFEELSIGLEY
ncbi:hypothetical protein AJ89_06265 [Lactococcus cremoris subsp. cremoris IBB477]|uniref:Uncharacterized protein n=1 Tax=Lactococcus cremoris subsp. cremoris IBB477 TaxID=1449093 RepID=A0A1E7G4G7_LACLC|nr:hypothetical protein [Lactococcus cremoris]OEU39837.1 hypothetical protein AJ89_06265 [Lactococcus cremoris subsp. cremoris IBB477]